MRQVGPGENVRVRLSGVEEDDLLSGFVLCSVGMFSPINLPPCYNELSSIIFLIYAKYL